MPRKPRIVVVGAGVAGSLIVSGLRDRTDCELICLEKVAATDHEGAGTGLNIGPNAMKCLGLFLPHEAAAIVSESLPWSHWSIALTSGVRLMDLPLSEVADNPGVRIRWANLYALLREPNSSVTTFNAELTRCGRNADGAFVTWTDCRTGENHDIGGIDLLIAGDGRYSAVRGFVLGSLEVPRFMHVCLTRVLAPAGSNCPIDDYGQWFNGPNRLLAFRVPGDLVYCTASFPIPPGSGIPETMKQPDFLGKAYIPADGSLSPQAAWIIESLTRRHESIHWSRLQDGGVNFSETSGMLLTGDAAHPVVPTLGQGASQACEDACVATDEIRLALAAGDPLALVPQRVKERRAARVHFVADFSLEATSGHHARWLRPGRGDSPENRPGL